MLSCGIRDSVVEWRVVDGLLSLLCAGSVRRWRRWWRLFLSGYRVIERISRTRSRSWSVDLFEVQGSNAVPDGAHRSLFSHVEDGDGKHAWAQRDGKLLSRRSCGDGGGGGGGFGGRSAGAVLVSSSAHKAQPLCRNNSTGKLGKQQVSGKGE